MAEGGDDHGVIDALVKAAGDDGADASCAGDEDGERAAVHGVVGEGETVALLEGFAGLLELEADGVGAFAEALDYVALAANPVELAGGCALCGGEEKDASGDADFKGHGGAAAECVFAQSGAYAPGFVGAEAVEDECLLLCCDGF